MKQKKFDDKKPKPKNNGKEIKSTEMATFSEEYEEVKGTVVQEFKFD